MIKLFFVKMKEHGLISDKTRLTDNKKKILLQSICQGERVAENEYGDGFIILTSSGDIYGTVTNMVVFYETKDFAVDTRREIMLISACMTTGAYRLKLEVDILDIPSLSIEFMNRYDTKDREKIASSIDKFLESKFKKDDI
jgi:hypothetical protein